MRVRILPFFCLGMLACTSPMDLAQRPALIEFETTRPAKEITACISQKWAQHTGTISTVITETGYMVSIINAANGAADASINVSEIDGKTKVHYGERVHWASPSWMMEAVQSCQ